MNEHILKQKLKACLIAGSIGDALAGPYENMDFVKSVNEDLDWSTSDDTQLTLATCEAIYNSAIDPAKVAERFTWWFNNQRLRGLGTSTLKALRDLSAGSHWALSGRIGEYAAGNGAAMRIAPLAFKKDVTRQTLQDICFMTHKNDEAYVGALAIYYAVLFALNGTWQGGNNLIDLIVPELPDTLVRDRLIEFQAMRDESITQVAKKCRPTAYVVNSVPMALFAAQKNNHQNFYQIITELILASGDTDTNCSMCAQILGTLNGLKDIPKTWLNKYESLNINHLIDGLTDKWEY